MFETFIAKRYLLSKKKVQFITIITLISVIGVTIGVAALVTVLSVFNGFNAYQLKILTGFDPHIRIEKKNGQLIQDYSAVIEKVKSSVVPKGITPYTQSKGVLSSKKNNVVVFIKGVDDKNIENVSDVKEKTGLGDFEFNDNENFGGIVLGSSLAAKFQARLRDTVTIMSPAGMEKALTQIVQPKILKFVVKGIFDSNNRDYDKFYAFVSVNYGQRLFELGNAVNGIDIKLDNIDKSEDDAEKIKAALGDEYIVNTWYNLHEDLYNVMKVERITAFIVLLLIIAVASFSIIGSLTMTVIEKKRDIGVLKAMGSYNSSIVKIFMYEGILIGIYGTVFGIILGLAVCFAQIKFKFFPLDPMVYSIDALPIDLRITDFIFISIATILISFLASLYPAMKAARQEPIESIRWE